MKHSKFDFGLDWSLENTLRSPLVALPEVTSIAALVAASLYGVDGANAHHCTILAQPNALHAARVDLYRCLSVQRAQKGTHSLRHSSSLTKVSSLKVP